MNRKGSQLYPARAACTLSHIHRLGSWRYLSAVMLQALWSAAAMAQITTQSVSIDEQCLLSALKEAGADTRVEQLRERCAKVKDGVSTSPPANTNTAEDKPAENNPASQKTEAIVKTINIPGGLAPRLRELLEKSSSETTIIERRIVSEIRSSYEAFALIPHRPNYLIPVSYQQRPDESITNSGAEQEVESQFQISFKFPLSRPLLDGHIVPMFAYTNRAWWQVYNSDRSRPFREYNHEPELFVLMPGGGGPSVLGWQYRMSSLGFNHQSNGRDVPRSRSWNRIVGEAFFDQGRSNWAALKLWYRLPEKDKVSPTDTAGDDNPDIRTYMGDFELRVGHAVPRSHNVTLMARKSFVSGGKGAAQLDWSYPARSSPGMRWYASLFSGYGDSLIDYNVKVTRVGLGIMLKDWF